MRVMMMHIIVYPQEKDGEGNRALQLEHKNTYIDEIKTAIDTTIK